MAEKLCIFCKHFKIRGGVGDTYGFGGEDYMNCEKDRQVFGMKEGGEESFREDMLFASACPDYKQVKP